MCKPKRLLFEDGILRNFGKWQFLHENSDGRVSYLTTHWKGSLVFRVSTNACFCFGFCLCFCFWPAAGSWAWRSTAMAPLKEVTIIFITSTKVGLRSNNREGTQLHQSVQSLSPVWLFATPWTAACQASLSITSSQSSPKPTSIKSVMPANHLILCHPLLLLPSVFSTIRVFSNESTLHIRWPNYWSFRFSISPSKECSGLISFTMDRLDLLAVQGTLKSLLQHHSSKASILQCSAFFIAQLSHPYMTTGKTIALTIGPLLTK